MIDWDEVKQASVSAEVVDKALGFLRKAWPGGLIEVGSKQEDRQGADFVGSHPLFDRKYYVDMKYRRPSAFKSSFAIEWWSKLPTLTQPGQLGWSMPQPDKLTTHILYVFEAEGMYLLDFEIMKGLVVENVGKWRSLYGSHVNQTTTKSGNSWASEVSFVPIQEIESAIIHRI